MLFEGVSYLYSDQYSYNGLVSMKFVLKRTLVNFDSFSETTYDVRLTSLGEDKKEKDRQSFSVSVKFSSDSQKIFQYQPKLSVRSYIC